MLDAKLAHYRDPGIDRVLLVVRRGRGAVVGVDDVVVCSPDSLGEPSVIARSRAAGASPRLLMGSRRRRVVADPEGQSLRGQSQSASRSPSTRSASLPK